MNTNPEPVDPDSVSPLSVPDLMKFFMRPAVQAMASRIESDLLQKG
jgi:hypothetical protein